MMNIKDIIKVIKFEKSVLEGTFGIEKEGIRVDDNRKTML